jgi:hypothetical protein
MSKIAREMHRAKAAHGKLPPEYQELSSDWTTMMQKLYPVWVLLGPGLSDPGHIKLRTRTIHLDSDELLGTLDDIRHGRLRRVAIIRTFGVAFHEVFHAKHTKLWVSEHDAALAQSKDPELEQLATDRRLLEEPRMEAHGWREFDPTGQLGRFVHTAIKTAMLEVLIPIFANRLRAELLFTGTVSRNAAGWTMSYLWARTHYGAIDAEHLAGLEAIWRQALGDADFQALDDLYAQLIFCEDGDNDTLTSYAQRYREIIGPVEDNGDVPSGDLLDALDEAVKKGSVENLEQLNEDVDLQETLDQLDPNEEHEAPRKGGGGAGAPSGRLPKRGVNRPPLADEIRAALGFARTVEKAIVRGNKRIDKRTPGGRFDGRKYARGKLERKMGLPQTATPWSIEKNVRGPIKEPPHIGIIVDTSGSMSEYEYALGPIVWELDHGLRRIGGKLVVGLFGNGSALLTSGEKPLELVPGIKVGGGTAFASDAIVLCTEHMQYDNPNRPCLLYVLSDGGWYDTSAGTEKIDTLAEHGVPTLHIAIGMPPLAVNAARVSLIQDPADVLGIVARDTVRLLEAQATKKRRAGGRISLSL